MKKTIVPLVCLALLILPLTGAGCSLAGPSEGNETISTRDYAYSGFTSLELDAGFTAEIIQDDSYSISVTAAESFLNDLQVQHRHDALILHVSPLNTQINSTKEVVITMPVLEGLNLSTGTTAIISGFDSSEDFVADISLGSELIGDIAADQVRLILATGSGATLNGSCNELVLDASGGSSADLEDFTVEDADIILGSGSKATVDVDGTMNVDLSLGSTLFYMGSPTIAGISITGGSRMKKK